MPVNLECIASCEHDFAGGARLFAFRPEPDERLHGGEALARQTFGIPVLSPITPHIAVWRSENPFAMTCDTAPGQVFLTASFGAGPWRPPRELAEMAAQRFRMPELVLRANWRCADPEPVLDRFEVELRAAGGELSFRSANFADETPTLDFAWGALSLPGHGEEPVAFNVRVRLPERPSRGKQTVADWVELTLTGSAVPIPRWVNY